MLLFRLQDITVAVAPTAFQTTHVCLLPAQPTDQVINIPIPISIQILITISILIQWARAKLQDREPKEVWGWSGNRARSGEQLVSDPNHIRASLKKRAHPDYRDERTDIVLSCARGTLKNQKRFEAALPYLATMWQPRFKSAHPQLTNDHSPF